MGQPGYAPRHDERPVLEALLLLGHAPHFRPQPPLQEGLALPIVVCCGFTREEGEWFCVRAQLVGACAARLSVTKERV
jgi:hypothetical protein